MWFLMVAVSRFSSSPARTPRDVLPDAPLGRSSPAVSRPLYDPEAAALQEAMAASRAEEDAALQKVLEASLRSVQGNSAGNAMRRIG